MSWKTTVFGLMAAIGAAITGCYSAGMIEPGTLPVWVKGVGVLMAAIGAAGVGLFARDNNKTSEDVGAGKTSTTAGNNLGLYVVMGLLGGGLMLLLAGCASFSTTMFRLESASATAGTNAVAGFNAYDRSVTNADARAQLEPIRVRVWDASQRLGASLAVAEHWRAAYETNGATMGQLQAVVNATVQESSNLVWLVQYHLMR